MKYKSFEGILQEMQEQAKGIKGQYRESKKLPHISPEYPEEQVSLLPTSQKTWDAIQNEYDVTKRRFGMKINFVSGSHKRNIIFRDVEHAFLLESAGFLKPAVILAGSVIEELLRLYLKHKNIKPIKADFEGYIKTCEQEKLLESGISRLSDSGRHFRNLVHLSKEKTKKQTISKSKAKGAVASIFTIANDF